MSAAVLAWLRFGRRYEYVAAEVGRFAADAAGANARELVEVEVKTSMGDLRRDFETKAYKHGCYRGEYSTSGWIPNRFYVAVPAGLKERAMALLAEKAPKYGVLSFNDDPDAYTYAVAWKRFHVAKRATQLHERAPSDLVREQFLLRMSSDLVHFHAMRSHYGGLMGKMQDLSKALSEPSEAPTP